MRINWKVVGQILARTVVVLSFLLVSGMLLASANGYLFNQSTFRFEETSLISLTVKPVPVTVVTNGKKRTWTREEINLTYLLPGQYAVEVRKEQYYPWTKTVTIQAGEAIIYPWVTLFLEDGKTQPASPEQIAALDTVEETPPDDPDFDVRGNELWVKPVSRTYPFPVTSDAYELVGRYSSPIQRAIWFQGRNRLKTHIVFQIDEEIHLIDRDGSNDVLIASLTSNTPSVFTVTNDGNLLVYRDGDTVLQRQLQ